MKNPLMKIRRTREFRCLNPWRLASLVVGLLLLVAGSIGLPSDDWDLGICFVMGLPAYVLAPWAFRQVFYFRWKWWFAAALAFWFSVDGTYWLYWGLKGFYALEPFRPANFFYCTPIFWIAGFIWNIDFNGLKTRRPAVNETDLWDERLQLTARLVFTTLGIVLMTILVRLVLDFPRGRTDGCRRHSRHTAPRSRPAAACRTGRS